MTKYTWHCTYDNGASNWKDSSRCLGRSNQPLNSESAKRQAKAHEIRTGHSGKTTVEPYQKKTSTPKIYFGRKNESKMIKFANLIKEITALKEAEVKNGWLKQDEEEWTAEASELKHNGGLCPHGTKLTTIGKPQKNDENEIELWTQTCPHGDKLIIFND